MEGWLVFEGTEIGNAVRTLSYLRNGLGGPKWEVAATGGDLGDVSQLGCYCDEMNDGPYVDPATDDAPWYDPTRPESDSFLGFFPQTVDVVPTLGRSYQPSGHLGGTLGRVVLGATLVQVSGLLISATPAGQQYGERWLIAALRGQCRREGCDLGTLCVLPACPEGSGYDSSNFRTLYRVGLVDYTPARPLAEGTEWHMRRVSFQLRSELPWLYPDPIPLALSQDLAAAAVVGTAVTNDWPGDAGVRIKIAAGGPDAVGPLRIAGVPRKAGTAECDTPGGFFGAVALYKIEDQWRSPLNTFAASSLDTDADKRAIDLTGHGNLQQVIDNLGHWPSEYRGVKYVEIPDDESNISASDAAALDITGDLALEVDVEIRDWIFAAPTGFIDLCSKWNGASQNSWLLRWNQTNRRLEFLHSSNGTATVSTATADWDPSAKTTAAAWPARQPRWRIRVDLDVNNGAAGHTVRFFVSENGVDYVLQGTFTQAGTTAIFNSTSVVRFCGREPGASWFRGKFYAGRIGSGLWTSPTIVSDPNIDTDASSTSATFSDGSRTWTINRPATGAKAAVVDRGLFVTGPDAGPFTQVHGFRMNAIGGAHIRRLPIPRADESFTVVWYGKVWGTTTGQTLMSQRTGSAGAGWEIRRGATANTPQVVVSDGTNTVTATAAGAVTAGQPFFVVLRRDVAADQVTCLVGTTAGTPQTDTTTGPIGVHSNDLWFVIGGLGQAGTLLLLNSADSEFYGAAYFGRALTTDEITAVETYLADTGGPLPAVPTPCFDVTVPSLPAGTELTIDGATHAVELRRQSDRVLVGGLDVLEIDGPMVWPEMGPCAEVCWSVDPGSYLTTVNPNSHVTIEQLDREV